MSIDSELRIIGTLSSHYEEADNVFDTLRQDDFASLETRALYGVLKDLNEAGEAWTLVDVKEAITGHPGDIQEAYNAAISATVGPSTLKGDIQRVKTASNYRKMTVIGRELQEGDYSIEEILPRVEAVLEEVASTSVTTPVGKMKGEIEEIAKRIENKTDDIKQYVTSGLGGLDALTNGFKPGNLVIVAARPAMGKTALALGIASNVALHAKPVLVFTLEMTKEELQERILYAHAQVNGIKAERGDLSPKEWERLAASLDAFSSGNEIYIDDKSGLTPQQIRAKARRINRECGGLGLVVVDYIQIMGVDGNWGNREQEVAFASRSLKCLAKDLNCPVIALSQLNRMANTRPDKRPNLSDLRESGAIEQDADVVLLLHRDDYYRKLDEEFDGKAECIVAKHRNGPTGSVEMRWVDVCARFEDM